MKSQIICTLKIPVVDVGRGKDCPLLAREFTSVQIPLLHDTHERLSTARSVMLVLHHYLWRVYCVGCIVTFSLRIRRLTSHSPFQRN